VSRVAALLAMAALALGAAGCGGHGGAPASAGAAVEAGEGDGPLRWAAPPQVYTPETLPGDRILTGRLRNQSVRRVRVNLADLKVLARNGDAVAAQPVFLQTFGKSLWSPGRGPDAMPDTELQRTGRLAWVAPGEEVPITVAWHARAGRPAAVDYGEGLVPVP
jgi:hypothetical protein